MFIKKKQKKLTDSGQNIAALENTMTKDTDENFLVSFV